MRQETREIIFNLSIFNKIDKSILEDICSYSSKKYIDKNNLIYTKDEPSKHLYVLVEGKIKVFHDTCDGKEIILDIINPQGFLGEECIFTNDSYSSNAETIENSIIISIPISKLKKVINDNHQFTLNLLSYSNNKLHLRELELEHCALQNTTQKIGCFFLQMVADEYDDGSAELTLPYEKNVISSKLGMKSETFSRSFRKLCEHTGLEVNGKNIRIPSIERLNNYVCETCSGTYPCKNRTNSDQSSSFSGE